MKRALLDFGRVRDWILCETHFDPTALGKAEVDLKGGYDDLG